MANKNWIKGSAFLIMTVLALAGCNKNKAEAQSVGTAWAANVEESPASDFSYKLTDDGRGIKITGYRGEGGDVGIPSTIEGKPVLEIDNGAFRGNHGSYEWAIVNTDRITSIVVPNSVEVIGGRAFAHMRELTKVMLPDGLKVLEWGTFERCPKLVSVNLPASLEEIGQYAFEYCRELSDLIIPESITGIKFTTWEGSEYDNRAFLDTKLPKRTQQTIESWGYTSGFSSGGSLGGGGLLF